MKHLLTYAAAIAVFFLGDRLGGYFLQKTTDASQFRWSRMARGAGDADILLLGNSRGMTFLEPVIEAKSGKRAFNLSYNGLPMDMAAALTADYFEKNRAPERLVIDVTLCDRRNKALFSGLMPFMAALPNARALLRDSVPDTFRGAQVSHLFRFNNEVFQRAFFHRKQTDAGFILDREIMPALAAEVSKNSYKLDVYPDLIEKLAQTVRLAQAKGTDVRLVVGPYFPKFEVKNLDALVKAAETATGLAVKNYRDELTEPRLFGDFMHPNRAGATVFIEAMRRDSVLP